MADKNKQTKLVRKEFPKVRQYKKRGYTYYSVDCRRKDWIGQKTYNFKRKEDAIRFAKTRGDQIKKKGTESLGVISSELEMKVKSWEEQLSIYGKSLEDAVEFMLKNLLGESRRRDSEIVSSLLTKWKCEKLEGEKHLRPRSLTSIKFYANKFIKDFGPTHILEITDQYIDNYFESLDELSNQTKRNYKSYLSQFFNWCINKKHITKNPTDHLSFSVESKQPPFLEFPQSSELMKKVQSSDLCGFFALGLFSGIRTEEATLLTWNQIVFDRRQIYMPPTIAKTKRERFIEISDNLFEWLKYFKLRNLKLIPDNFWNR